MAKKDQEKWDKKYTEKPQLLQKREASKKLEIVLKLSKGKTALDVACGSGRNALFLAKNGFKVDAYDISKIALDTLNSKGYNTIHTKLVDLGLMKNLGV